MPPRSASAPLLIAGLLTLTSCGASQTANNQIDTRPLEESKAFEIIEETLGERNLLATKDVPVEMSNKVRFTCDFRVDGESIAIEFLSQQDRLDVGEIPAPAPGSRLHVLAARTVSNDPNEPGEPLYILFIDDRKFVYQFNPTSELRANVTFLEIDSRLRRDLADFLSWHEANKKE